jgi:autotransporter-associated beta strand protein
LAGLALGYAVAPEARAQQASTYQLSSPVDIPLTGKMNEGRYLLGINVGINGSASQPYLFDTGSSPFNAAYSSSTWGGVVIPNGSPKVTYSYGPDGSFGSVTGNVVQIHSLSFYNQTGNVIATLTDNPGYMVTALSAPPSFNNLSANFNGIFGAGNFSTELAKGIPQGGVLGQTKVSNATQGYVVAANGNLGSRTLPFTACSPCVTLGLTKEMLGQFFPVGLPPDNPLLSNYPVNAESRGVVPVTPGPPFNNPSGGSIPGNNGSTEFGAQFVVSLTSTGGPAVTTTAPTLLDTGAHLFLPSALCASAVATNCRTANAQVNAGVTLTATGVTTALTLPERPRRRRVTLTTDTTAAAVPGLPTSSEVLTSGASFYPSSSSCISDNGCSRIGIWYFLQNSVLYDLSDSVIGYTPFFVTDTPTSAPLAVDRTNFPIGLAGAITGGRGGVTVSSGGRLQLSATNTYTGPTTIAAAPTGPNTNAPASGNPQLAGQLYISGPGSIASSSGMSNEGVFDISRAWSTTTTPVTIQALSGSGEVYLGGQNLAIASANSTFSGTIGDANTNLDNYGYPGTGGTLTITGGTQTLSGANTYTGSTTIAAGARGAASGRLNISGSGSIASSARLINDGVFDISGASAPVSIQELSGWGGQGRVYLGSQNLIIKTDPDAGNLFFGTIADGGGSGGAGGSLTIARGWQNLAGYHTYTGDTTVQAGATLGLNNSRITSNLSNSGTIEVGNASITGIVSNSGTISMGVTPNGPTTLTIDGAYGQAADSFFAASVAAGRASRIIVTGTPGIANLAGTVEVSVLTDAGPGRYTILTADGGLNGCFLSRATVLEPPSLTGTISCDSNSVSLTLSAK